MQFLGSVRLDGSKRVTLIKEVADILELGPQDHVMFYIDNGEIILRRVLKNSGDQFSLRNGEFWEWARKRQIEIDMLQDSDVKEQYQEDLNSKMEAISKIEEQQNSIVKG